MPRGAPSDRIGLRLPPELRERLMAAAEMKRVAYSRLVIFAIMEYLNRSVTPFTPTEERGR